MPTSQHRRALRAPLASLLLIATLALPSSGCSSIEKINTDKVFLLGPRRESEPGPATRDVTVKAIDTRGTLAFHVDRARQCTVTSTPRYQVVHIEGKKAKNVAASILTGSLLVAAGGGIIASSFFIDDGNWKDASGQGVTGAGYVGVLGVVTAAVGLFFLPRGIYHAAISGTTTTFGEVQTGTPPPGGVRAPAGYDPKDPQVTALAPRTTQPRYGILDFAAQPAADMRGTPWAPAKPAQPVESLRSASAFDRATAPATTADPALLALPQYSGAGDATDPMRVCVSKYAPICQQKCGSDRACTVACLRKPCVEKLEEEAASGNLGPDEDTTVITRTETCERSPDGAVGLTLVLSDRDGVPRTIDLGKTDRNGDVKKDVLAGLEAIYPGWPEVKQIITQEARIVLTEDPSVEMGKLDLAKYPALRYAEHVRATKTARDAMAAADAQKREREAKERQAAFDAAAKAQYEAEHAGEIKAEAARKAQACLQQAQSRCSADCQGNQACVKRCMQKVSCR